MPGFVLAALLPLAACAPEEPAASATPQPTPEPTPSPTLSAELLNRPWNVLYVGLDQNEQREGAGEPKNTDALMLASLSEDQSELTLVSLPRDTVDVPLPDGSVWPRKINALYGVIGLPTSFVVGRDGRAVAFGVGPHGWGNAPAHAFLGALLAEPVSRAGAR